MRYKRKPVEVQALQWTGENFDFMQEFCSHGDKALVQEIGGDLKLLSLDGYMTAHAGDFIIQSRYGEIYPCSEQRFREIYEAIE